MIPSESAIETRILELVAEVSPVPRDQIHRDADFGALRLDSVGSMELVSMMCDEFGIEVEIEEAFAIGTVRDAVSLTLRHLEHAGR